MKIERFFLIASSVLITACTSGHRSRLAGVASLIAPSPTPTSLNVHITKGPNPSADGVVIADATPIPDPSPSVISPSPSPSASPAHISNSQKYAPYDIASETRQTFTYAQDDKLDNYRKNSPNYDAVTKILTAAYTQKRTMKNVQIDSSHNLIWVENGVGKDSQLLLVDSTWGVPPVELFSTFQEGVGIAAEITGFAASPDGKYVYVEVSYHGSIDQIDAVIINVKTGSVMNTLHLAASTITWASPTTILYDKLTDDGDDNMYLNDVTTGEDSTQNAGHILAQNSKWLFKASDGIYLQKIADGSKQIANMPMAYQYKIVGNDDQNVYFLNYGTSDNSSTIVQVPITPPIAPPAAPSPGPSPSPSNAMLVGQVLTKETTLYVDNAFADTGAVFAQYRAGADRFIRVLQAGDGKILGQVNVPDCCSVKNVRWAEAGKSIRITLGGALSLNTQNFIWDFTTSKWDIDPASTMLVADGVTYVSEVIYSTSKDGVKIPTRLIHRQDLKQDSSNPVEIQSYGGFNLPGYIDPSFDAPTYEFLKRGGIYAAPALRGGNEYGQPWHKAAMFQNKIKTFEDLDSVSQQLTTLQWSKPSLTIIRGTSNGGLTASATALLFPNDFGLSIPIAGVDDLLGKDAMDPMGNPKYDGWSDEYGEVSTSSDYLSQISPVENASKQGGVKFLIVDGVDDTRVNPAHSVKLAKALEDQGGHVSNVFLLTVSDAGHATESFSQQNAIGLGVEINIWTMIYDLAGWKAQP